VGPGSLGDVGLINDTSDQNALINAWIAQGKLMVDL